ncbi:MAG: hypothetical protein ACK5AZ_08045 [Bryobacteraceae bacterium]
MAAKRGRPTKLTPEIQKVIVDAINAGGFIETSVTLAGISRDTFYEWLKRGNREKSGIYRDFTDAIKKALASAETHYMALIGRAAKTQWQAAAWMLERRFRQNWAKSSDLTIKGPTSS